MYLFFLFIEKFVLPLQPSYRLIICSIMDNQKEVLVLKCKASTDVNKLAGSIHSTFVGNPDADIVVRVIGAGALNQAVKGAIICNKFFAKKGLVVLLQPSFQDAEGAVTAIELKVILMKH